MNIDLIALYHIINISNSIYYWQVNSFSFKLYSEVSISDLHTWTW